MFRELRDNYGLTQVDVADATGRSPNYILKAEDLAFPSPSPALMQFYLDLDPTLDREFLTSWYESAQVTQRRDWLDLWTPSDVPGSNFRLSWELKLPSLVERNPTQYRLSKGLCIPAAVVYNMERTRKLPGAVGVVLDQLIHYTKSGEYDGVEEDTAADVTNRLISIQERFV